MPELFIIGAQRSGTTYLYDILDSHPQVLMAKPVRPEPKFFLDEDEWRKGKKYYESFYFRGRSNSHKYIGEKSTSYIEHKIVADRIKSYYPNVRILIILRDPVKRAFSNYRFSVENGIESLSFSDALSAECKRLSVNRFDSSVNPYAYQARGHYINYLRDYADVFARSQIYVIIHEELVSNMKAITDIYTWLNVDDRHVFHDFKKKINSTIISDCSDEIVECKNDLYHKYNESNEQLEEYLGRKIEAWRHV